MKMNQFLAILLTPLLISSCDDVGNQVEPSLKIQTSAAQYRSSDTVGFTIRNTYPVETYIPACNLKLTYFLQSLDNGVWQDRFPVNIGPCLHVYPAYLILPSSRSLSQQLPLVSLSSVAAGTYRIKIEYRLPDQTTVDYAHSNIFKITE